MGGWGGPPSGGRQVVRSTKQVLLAFRISAAWSPQNALQMLSLDKNNVSRHAERSGSTLTMLSQLLAFKRRLPFDKNSVSMVSKREKDYKPCKFDLIDLQEGLLEHQLNTFQMCPDGVSTCNSIPHIQSIALVVQMHTNVT